MPSSSRASPPTSAPRTSSSTNDQLAGVLAERGVTVLAPSPAQDANTFVVTRETAEREHLRTLSDLAAVAPEMTFAGPPECPSRPFCLLGLERVYGLTFREVLALDAGGPLTHQAIASRDVDVALSFTTDPALIDGDLVELEDDRDLQPAENITPLVRSDVIDHFGPVARGPHGHDLPAADHRRSAGAQRRARRGRSGHRGRRRPHGWPRRGCRDHRSETGLALGAGPL